jgi:hypothetical protein
MARQGGQAGDVFVGYDHRIPAVCAISLMGDAVKVAIKAIGPDAPC